MRISAKGRYALAAVISMAQQHPTGESVTLISISERLGISKIYLEQVFALLKRAELVTSVKGAQGGYQLARPPRMMTAFDVLSAVETTLFDKTEDTVLEKSPEIEAAMRFDVFDLLDGAVAGALQKVNIEQLVLSSERRKGANAGMFYI
ncbi:MAG: Rrf2 family transcriptional regulator [Eubacteriales bacterium]|nr:Rrf2 family transcriptional regulator [Eubacteriales bacterium]